MSSRTKSNPVATLTPAEQSKVNLANAKAKRIAFTDNLAAAIEAREELDDRLRSGDDSVTSPDILAAGAEVERWTVLLDAAHRAVQRAERALLAEEHDLADALAESVSAALRLPVTVHNEVPDVPSAVGTPEVFLVQTKPTVRDTVNGTLSGDIDVLYVRSEFHASPDLTAVQRVAESRKHGHNGVSVNHQGERIEGEVIVETFRLSVAYGAPAVPLLVLNPDDSFQVLTFGRMLHNDLYANVGYSGAPLTGVSMGSGTAGVRQAEVVQVEHDAPTAVSDRTDSSGIRRRTVEVTVSVWPGKGNPWTVEELGQKAVNAVESQAGRFVASLGRIGSVKVVRHAPTESGRGRHVSGHFEFVSKVA